MELKKIAVIGCGTMGRGIIQVAAAAGFQVTAVDTFPKALEGARASIKKGFDKWAEKGKLTAEQAAQAFQAVTFSSEIKAAAEAQLIVEAIVEKLESPIQGTGRPGRARDDPGQQHLLHLHNPAGRPDQAARQGHRDAFHEPGPLDAPGGGHSRPGHERRRDADGSGNLQGHGEDPR